MGFVAARVTGETDVTPTKALGPVTQLIYGAITARQPAGKHHVRQRHRRHRAARRRPAHRRSRPAELLGANPRAAALRAALRRGRRRGCRRARVQFARSPTPDGARHRAVGRRRRAWSGPASRRRSRAASAALHPTARTATLIGFVLGAVLVLIRTLGAPRASSRGCRRRPASASRWSSPASNAIAMFLGAADRRVPSPAPARAGRASVVPVSSGLIAGESLMGIVVALLVAAGVLTK